MSRTAIFQEELELDLLREQEQELSRRQKEFADLPNKIALELKERECTMPPLAEIAERERQRAHENTLTRGAVKNILRTQAQDAMLFFLLLAATATLIWWGIKLMNG
jgi:hypothetical protein